MKVALVGNPNVGKTALINALTGGDFVVGNFPGVTVEKKEGKVKIDGREVTVIDLPGIYSFETNSIDERITKEYIEKERPDLILNVVNAANLERNLYLTLQLADFQIPMVLVLNMIDEAERRGVRIDSKKLEEILGVPVVETVANRGEGIDELKREILGGGRVPKALGASFEEKVKIAERIAKEVLKVEGVAEEIELDEVFLDRYLGIPIFFSLMWMMFVFTYDVAAPLVDLLDSLFESFADSVAARGGVFFDMLGHGVVAGVGSVLVFLPNITFLFIALSLLELSGYMARAVYLSDAFMSRFGLSGRSVAPLLMGFGCNVPAVLATRGIEDNRVRLATIIAVPFMSCNARLPIYGVFIGYFFPKSGSVVMMILYATGVVVALLSAMLLRRTILRGEASFVLEFPPYMLPQPKEVAALTWSRVKHFLQKAGTIILAMSVVLWFITSYPEGEIENTVAGTVGKAILPLFQPLGWDYKFVLALLTGFIAKEVVVATLEITGANVASLTSIQAMAYMLFTLLYMPCFATIAAIKSEAGTRWAVFAVLYSFAVAYLVSLAVGAVGWLL